MKTLLLVLCLLFCFTPLLHSSNYEVLIKKYSLRYSLNWKLVSAQVYAESGFDKDAISPVGAFGLMQIMPGTAKWLGVSPKVLTVPKLNIALGCRYDNWLWQRFSEKDWLTHTSLMLASYNWGIGNVGKQYNEDIINFFLILPDETFNYLFRIYSKYTDYQLSSP